MPARWTALPVILLQQPRTYSGESARTAVSPLPPDRKEGASEDDRHGERPGHAYRRRRRDRACNRTWACETRLPSRRSHTLRRGLWRPARAPTAVHYRHAPRFGRAAVSSRVSRPGGEAVDRREPVRPPLGAARRREDEDASDRVGRD